MASADPDTRRAGHAPLRRACRTSSPRPAATPPSPRRRQICASLGLPGPGARPAAGHAVRRAAAPGRAGPDPVRRRPDAAARRADQPPRRRLDRLAARVPARAQGRPGRDQPRRRPAARRASTGSSTWTPTAPRSTSTTWAGRRTSSSARPTSAGAGASGPTPRSRPPRCAPRPTGCAHKATKAEAAQNMDRRAERLLAGLEETRRSDRVARLRFPDPAPCGKTPLTRRRAVEVVRLAGGLHRRRPRRRPRRRASSSSG